MKSEKLCINSAFGRDAKGCDDGDLAIVRVSKTRAISVRETRTEAKKGGQNGLRHAQPDRKIETSKRSAFLAAQKELKAKYPNPYYWGAFVMVGE